MTDRDGRAGRGWQVGAKPAGGRAEKEPCVRFQKESPAMLRRRRAGSRVLATI
jgi:hypothetical protein